VAHEDKRSAAKVRLIGYIHLLLNAAAALIMGLMGLAFVVLAVYLAFTGASAASSFSVKQLMMPMMNMLIASVLLYYCRLLTGKTAAVWRALAADSYAPPHIRPTKYDLIAIAAFIALVGLIFFFISR
jgi:hypothetical protein